MERDTVGKITAEILAQGIDPIDPREVQREHEKKEYFHDLYACIYHAKGDITCEQMPSNHKKCNKYIQPIQGDFYIDVELKKEQLLVTTMRHYFVAHVACPTPFYDQTVYKYNSKDDSIEYLWTIPDRDLCNEFMKYHMYVHPEEVQLLQFIHDFKTGKLLKRCKELNKETSNAGIILKRMDNE